MDLKLILMEDSDIPEFKKAIQEAFQKGFEDELGKTEETILPEKDIDEFHITEFFNENIRCPTLPMILSGMGMRECLLFKKQCEI